MKNSNNAYLLFLTAYSIHVSGQSCSLVFICIFFGLSCKAMTSQQGAGSSVEWCSWGNISNDVEWLTPAQQFQIGLHLESIRQQEKYIEGNCWSYIFPFTYSVSAYSARTIWASGEESFMWSYLRERLSCLTLLDFGATDAVSYICHWLHILTVQQQEQ